MHLGDDGIAEISNHGIILLAQFPTNYDQLQIVILAHFKGRGQVVGCDHKMLVVFGQLFGKLVSGGTGVKENRIIGVDVLRGDL